MPIFDSWVSRCIELPNLVTPTRETSPWHDQWLDLSSGVATIGQRCKRGQRVTSATSKFSRSDSSKNKKKRSMLSEGCLQIYGAFFSLTHSFQRVLTFIWKTTLLIFCPKFSLTWQKFTNLKWETHLYFHMLFFYPGIYVASLTAPGGSKKRQERRKIGPSNSKRSAPAAWEEMVSTAPHRPMIRFRPRRGRRFLMMKWTATLP